MNEPRNSLVTIELMQDSPVKPDPLEVMWAAQWQLSDLINRLALYAYTSLDVIHHQDLSPNPDEKQKDFAIRAISNATSAIRQLAVRPLFDNDGEPQQIVFVYMGAMYGVTAIKESK